MWIGVGAVEARLLRRRGSKIIGNFWVGSLGGVAAVGCRTWFL